MFTVPLPDPVQCLPQTVFFIRKVNELPRGDSSVRLHDTAYRVRVEPQVHSADPLLLYGLIVELPFLLIREPQEIFPVTLLQGRGRCLHARPVLPQVLGVRVQEHCLYPHPVLPVIKFETGRVPFAFPVHVPPVKYGHRMRSLPEDRGLPFPSAFLPLCKAGPVRCDHAQRVRNGRSAQVRRHFRETHVEVVHGPVLLCTVHKVLRKIEPAHLPFDR